MRSIALFITRVIFGSYLAVHGAQKLFGSFGGYGLEATGSAFEGMGLKPGKAMAAVAGASELGGGVLTATGIADPLGPLTLVGTMAVASTVHRQQGPLSTNGGFELPLTNFALALTLMTTGPGHLRLGPHLSRHLTRAAAVGGVALAGYSISQLLRNKPGPVLEVVDDPGGPENDEDEVVAPSSF